MGVPGEPNPLHEARAEFSTLVERALNGEPQRVTHSGQGAVVIVSEADRARGAPTLADLLEHAGEEGCDTILDHGKGTVVAARPLGHEFLAEGG